MYLQSDYFPISLLQIFHYLCTYVYTSLPIPYDSLTCRLSAYFCIIDKRGVKMKKYLFSTRVYKDDYLEESTLIEEDIIRFNQMKCKAYAGQRIV